MKENWGYIENEQCNRNGCTGILYMKKQEGQCTCHIGHPPCYFCVNSIGCCSECGWNEIESLGTREVLIEKSTFYVLLRAPGHPKDLTKVKVMECESSDIDEGTKNAYLSLILDKNVIFDEEAIYKEFYKIYAPDIGFNWNLLPKMCTSLIKKTK